MAKEELATSADELTEDGNIDKIRDILFGVHVRDFEKRFAELDEKFSSELGDLRNDLQKKLDKLESILMKETATLKGRIDDEPFLRDDAIKNATAEIRKSGEGMEKEVTSFIEKYSESENELRAQILQQSIMLMDSIQKKEGEIMSTLEQQAKGLRDETADRAALADLFKEMANRLTESPEPDSE